MKTEAEITIYFPKDRKFVVNATFTQAACIVVHPTVHWPIDGEPEIIENNWTISQYPTGYKLFSELPTKNAALAIVNTHLNSHLFVGMNIVEFFNDFRARNLTETERDEGIRCIKGAKDDIEKYKEGLLP